MPRPNQSLFVLVNNDAEAQAYIVYPNQTVYLLNLKDLILTIKKADKDGLYEPEKYYLSRESKNDNTDLKTPNFATIDQFNDLQYQINEITQKLAKFKAKNNEPYNLAEESGD
jgi:hypothetical protein